MEVIKHFKMYKKGKKWCTMALATAAVTLGATMVTAHADETALLPQLLQPRQLVHQV